MPLACAAGDRQSDIEHQNELLLGKTRDDLTERELNEVVHWDASGISTKSLEVVQI